MQRALTDGGLPALVQTRQVLIDGVGIPGLTLAALLRQMGHDPVLVGSSTVAPKMPITTVSPSGLRALDVTGVGDTVREAGRALDVVTVRSRSGDSRCCRTFTSDDDTPVPFVVETPVLRDALSEAVSMVPQLRSCVESVSHQSGVHEVRFANGVRECFDVVVAAGYSTSTARATAVREPEAWATISGIDVPLNSDNAVPALPLESWHGRVAVQVLPPPNTGADGVLRVLSESGVDEELDASATIAAAFPDAADDTTNAWASALELATWTPVPQGDVETAEWVSDGVAYCGTAAFPAPHLTGLHPSLGIEDAWVLADELGRVSDDTRGALRAYARRRRTRIQRLVNQRLLVGESRAYPEVSTEPLQTTSRLRATTLASLCSSTNADLQRADLTGL